MINPTHLIIHNTREYVNDLPDQYREARIVTYHIIGDVAFVVQRNLKIFSNFTLIFVKKACFFRPIYP